MANDGNAATTKPRRAKRREKPQQIADELRQLIIAGELDEGDSLGNETDLIGRFGVSRPSLREALRILETEGLISVIRGVRGGVVVHRPDQRQTARTAALVLQARNVPLADVFKARAVIEPAAAALVAASRGRKGAGKRLRELIEAEAGAIDDPERFAVAHAAFHAELVALAGNQTLSIVSEMLDEVVTRAVIAGSQRDGEGNSPLVVRRRGVRGQERLVELIEAGDAKAAEDHWRTHLAVVGKVILGQQAETVVDLMDHL